MLKNTPALSMPFELQRRVIKHLAEHPGCRILEIQRGVEANYHSAVSRAIMGLSKEGLVKEAPRKNQWILTARGFKAAVRNSIADPLAIKRYALAYQSYYPEVQGYMDYVDMVERAAGDQSEEILGNLFKFIVSLEGFKMSFQEEIPMINCILATLLGEDGWARFIALSKERELKKR